MKYQHWSLIFSGVSHEIWQSNNAIIFLKMEKDAILIIGHKSWEIPDSAEEEFSSVLEKCKDLFAKH